MRLKTKEVIERAARLIAEEGWIQREYCQYTPTGKAYCIVGAIEAIEFDFDGNWESVQRAKRKVQNCLDSSLEKWNDAEGRTAEEVYDLLIGATRWEEK